MVIASRTPDGIALAVYEGGQLVRRVVLTPKRAMLLGVDLIDLAAEPVFQAQDAKTRGSKP